MFQITQEKKIEILTPSNCFCLNIYIPLSPNCFQHFGRSLGGGRVDSLGPLPLSTKKAILSPHVVCTSRWQCMNQTPTEKEKMIVKEHGLNQISKSQSLWNSTENIYQDCQHEI